MGPEAGGCFGSQPLPGRASSATHSTWLCLCLLICKVVIVVIVTVVVVIVTLRCPASPRCSGCARLHTCPESTAGPGTQEAGQQPVGTLIYVTNIFPAPPSELALFVVPFVTQNILVFT